MSTKAQEIRAKLKQRQEDAAVVTEVWHGLFPGSGWELKTQAMTWLVQGHSLESIIHALEQTVIQRSKRDTAVAAGAKGASLMTADQAIAYASAIMHKLKFEALPEEEKANIHAVRSAAGRKGGIAKAAIYAAKKKVDSPSQNLPQAADALPPSYSGSGSNSHSNSDAFTVSATPESKPTAGSSLKGLEQKPEPKNGSGLKLDSKQQGKTGKSKNGVPFPADFDHAPWRNSDRLQWLHFVDKTGRAPKFHLAADDDVIVFEGDLDYIEEKAL